MLSSGTFIFVGLFFSFFFELYHLINKEGFGALFFFFIP